MYIRVKYLIEYTGHGDGYCSDAECEYSAVTRIEKLTEKQFSGFNDIVACENLANIDFSKLSTQNLLQNYLYDKIAFSEEFDKFEGSGYCQADQDCIDHGLGVHDLRITILDVRLVDNTLVKSAAKK